MSLDLHHHRTEPHRVRHQPRHRAPLLSRAQEGGERERERELGGRRREAGGLLPLRPARWPPYLPCRPPHLLFFHLARWPPPSPPPFNSCLSLDPNEERR